MTASTGTPSTVKVTNLIRELVEQAPELQRQVSGVNALMLAPLMGFLPQLERMLIDRLPDDPAVLDALLERSAELVLSLRSDTAGPGAELVS